MRQWRIQEGDRAIAHSIQGKFFDFFQRKNESTLLRMASKVEFYLKLLLPTHPRSLRLGMSSFSKPFTENSPSGPLIQCTPEHWRHWDTNFYQYTYVWNISKSRCSSVFSAAVYTVPVYSVLQWTHWRRISESISVFPLTLFIPSRDALTVTHPYTHAHPHSNFNTLRIKQYLIFSDVN